MWFDILKIKRMTGKAAMARHAKDIVDKYLLTVEIGHKFLGRDVLEFAKVNNLLEGIEHKMSTNFLGSALRRNIKVVYGSLKRIPNSTTYINEWERVK
jgi:hypothetical protein